MLDPSHRHQLIRDPVTKLLKGAYVDTHKYDIAFSFLAKDEHIALEINGRLKNRYNTFVYSEQQKNLAGKDGEGAFKKVFETEAKIVIVLFRSEWGTTPWTRMEETGIRDRAYKFGYDFVTFIGLEDHPKMPDWFPKQRLYVSYPRFGIDSAVIAIEMRAQEAQLSSREPTTAERAEALEKRRNFEASRRAFLYSHEGGQAIQIFFADLHALIKTKIAEISQAIPSLRINDRSNHHQIGITAEGPSLMVSYKQNYINSIDGSLLRVELYTGGPPLDGLQYYDRPQKYRSFEMHIDRSEELPLCWHHKGRNLTNPQAADEIVRFWLEHQPTGRESR